MYPGIAAGQVAIRLHDFIFSGDHVLGRITPHQSPEWLTLNTGLGHYLESLELIENWASHPTLTLAGHDDPIKDLPARISEIREGHDHRLKLTLKILSEPHTIAEVSAELFGEVRGYDTLLAIEETGAHVEYLHQLGLLRITNVDNLGAPGKPMAVRYQRVSGPVMTKMKLI